MGFFLKETSAPLADWQKRCLKGPDRPDRATVIRLLRQAQSCNGLPLSLEQIKRAAELVAEEGLTPLHAAGAVDAAGLAVNVHGGPGERRRWNIEHGHAIARCWKQQGLAPYLDL